MQWNFLWSVTPAFIFLFFGCLMGLGITPVQAQTGIEGKWKDPASGGIILIYEESGRFFGQLVGSEKPEENTAIQKQGDILVLKDFEKKSEFEFCCGTAYQPRKKRTLSATLILEDENTLKINASAGLFKGTQILTRV